jgi:hypothetical protein
MKHLYDGLGQKLLFDLEILHKIQCLHNIVIILE